jgi:hypothetical protein
MWQLDRVIFGCAPFVRPDILATHDEWFSLYDDTSNRPSKFRQLKSNVRY